MPRKFSWIWIASLLCGSCAPAVYAGGQTIKVKTELVELRTVVTDRQGRFVENLGRDDFELLVNGKPKGIDFFSVTRVDDPQPPDARGKEAETKSLRSRLAEPPVRTVVLFVDTLHLSASSLIFTKQALRKFVDERLTDQDVVALVTSSGSLGIAEQFTRNRELLRYGIERITPGPYVRQSYFTPYLASCIARGDSEALALGIQLVRLEDGADGDRRMMEMIARARASEVLSQGSYLSKATLLTLREVAGTMADLPGRRMIVLFSDGFTLQDNGGGMQAWEVETVTSRAVRSGVVIYSIAAQGLQPPPMANAAMRGGAAGPRLDSYLSASEMDEQDAMNALAYDTGGEMYRNTNDLGGALVKAFDANKSYYVLAYYLESESRAPQFRRISVRIKDHPEYRIRSPRGYFSNPARAKPAETDLTPAQRIARAIQEPLPRTALDISASAEYFEADAVDGQVTVSILIGADGLQYRGQDQRFLAELEVRSAVFDSSGKQVDGYTDTVKANLAADRLAVARRNGFLMTRRLFLKPGVYQVRAGVRETATDRIGTAFAWVEVPNLTRTRFALSSLIVGDPPGAPAAGASATALHSRVVQGVRLFAEGKSCAYFLRIQKGGKSAAEVPLVYQLELLRRGETVLQYDWKPATSPEKDSKGVSLSGQFGLTGLPAGIYELRVTVKEPQSKRTFQRTAVIGIE